MIQGPDNDWHDYCFNSPQGVQVNALIKEFVEARVLKIQVILRGKDTDRGKPFVRILTVTLDIAVNESDTCCQHEHHCDPEHVLDY